MSFANNIFVEKFNELMKEGKIKIDDKQEKDTSHRQCEKKNSSPLKLKPNKKNHRKDL